MRTDRPIVQSLEPRRLLAVDLQAGFSMLSSELVGEDFPIRIAARLRNGGDAATPGTVGWRVILASDEAGTQNVVELGSGTRPSIAGGGTQDVFALTFPVPTSTLGTARHLILIADPANAVAENDETDNRGVRRLEIARTLPADGILTATDGDDSILVAVLTDVEGGEAFSVDGVAGAGEIDVLVGRVADYARLVIDLRGGNDSFSARLLSTPIPVDVFGNDGNDTIRGSGSGSDDDTIDGGAGDDRLEGAGRLNGDVGRDRIVGSDGPDTIDGGEGDDIIYGRAGDDTILGGAGDDIIDAGGGADTVDGGDGADYVRGDGMGRFRILDPLPPETVTPGDDFLRGDDGRDTLHGDGGDDTLNGNAGGDSLNGGVGDDLLQGNGGNDRIRGAAGLDRLYGGAGDDYLDGRDAGTRDILSGREGRDTGFFDGLDYSSSIEVSLR